MCKNEKNHLPLNENSDIQRKRHPNRLSFVAHSLAQSATDLHSLQNQPKRKRTKKKLYSTSVIQHWNIYLIAYLRIEWQSILKQQTAATNA